MKLINRSGYPDSEVRSLIIRSYRGSRTIIVSRYRTLKGGVNYTPRVPSEPVLLSVGSPTLYPQHDDPSTGTRSGPHAKLGSIVLRSWQEELVKITGHEAHHLSHMSAPPSDADETAAERAGRKALEKYRKTVRK